MKKKISLYERLRFTWHGFRGLNNSLIVNCHYCKGTNIKLLESNIVNDEYTSLYRCYNCGATAQNKEVWIK